jgi:hypothetical protein
MNETVVRLALSEQDMYPVLALFLPDEQRTVARLQQPMQHRAVADVSRCSQNQNRLGGQPKSAAGASVLVVVEKIGHKVDWARRHGAACRRWRAHIPKGPGWPQHATSSRATWLACLPRDG